MATQVLRVRNGQKLSCTTSAFPAPQAPASWPIPAFPSVQTSLLELSLVAIPGSAVTGVLIQSMGTLPGASSAAWTLYHLYYQGSAPSPLPTPDIIPLTLVNGAVNQTLANPMANAQHIFWLACQDGTLLTIYPQAGIITPVDPTQSNITTALASLTAIASANVLAAGDKPGVIIDWNALSGSQSALDTQAGTYSISHSAFDAAITALSSYLTGLSPAWNDCTQNTTIVGSTFQSLWTTAYNSQSSLQTAITAYANSGVTAINSVNSLTNSDKIDLMSQYASEISLQTQLDSMAGTAGVSHAAYDATLTSLSAGIVTATGVSNWATIWPDGTTTSATGITTSLQTLWANIAAARKSLENAIVGTKVSTTGTAANASTLLGATWASPSAIGSSTPAAGTFTSVSASTGSFSGALTLSAQYTNLTNSSAILQVGNGTGSPTVVINGSAANGKWLEFNTNSLSRWNICAIDSETGSNTGSDMFFEAFNDAGTLIDLPFYIYRAGAGAINIGGSTARQTNFSGLVAHNAGLTSTTGAFSGSLTSGANTTIATGSVTTLRATNTLDTYRAIALASDASYAGIQFQQIGVANSGIWSDGQTIYFGQASNANTPATWGSATMSLSWTGALTTTGNASINGMAIGYNSTWGSYLQGKSGAQYDFSLVNQAGNAYIMGVTPGTTTVNFLGATNFSGAGTFNGAFQQSGSYAGIGSYNSSGVYPVIGNNSGYYGLDICRNFTNGSSEVDFFNNTVGAAGSFNFYQMTGVSSGTLLASLAPTGALTLTAGLSATSGNFSGTTATSVASTAAIDHNTVTRLMDFGPNTSTLGQIQTWLYSSNASVYANPMNITSTGVNVSALTASGLLTANGSISTNQISVSNPANTPTLWLNTTGTGQILSCNYNGVQLAHIDTSGVLTSAGIAITAQNINSSTNIVLNPASGCNTYLNWFSGTGNVIFGNGAQSQIAEMTGNGALTAISGAFSGSLSGGVQRLGLGTYNGQDSLTFAQRNQYGVSFGRVYQSTDAPDPVQCFNYILLPEAPGSYNQSILALGESGSSYIGQGAYNSVPTWSMIYTSSNIGTSNAAQQALQALVNAPFTASATYTTLAAIQTAYPAGSTSIGLYPVNSYLYAPGVIDTAGDNTTGTLYKNTAGTWVRVGAGNAILGKVTAGNISAGSVGAVAIQANSIGASQINASSIATAILTASSITTSMLQANCVTAGQIAANTITASQINASSISSAILTSNSITTSMLQANCITASQLATNVVLASQVVQSTSFLSGGTGYSTWGIAGQTLGSATSGFPTGWALYGNGSTVTTAYAPGTGASGGTSQLTGQVIGEIGGNINFGGYPLSQLGIAKLFYSLGNYTCSAPGAFSWTAPQMGSGNPTYQILVTICGGGEGGSGNLPNGSVYSHGGGGGACASVVLDVVAGSIISGSIGAGGAGGVGTTTTPVLGSPGGSSWCQLTGNVVNWFPFSLQCNGGGVGGTGTGGSVGAGTPTAVNTSVTATTGYYFRMLCPGGGGGYSATGIGGSAGNIPGAQNTGNYGGGGASAMGYPGQGQSGGAGGSTGMGYGAGGGAGNHIGGYGAGGCVKIQIL